MFYSSFIWNCYVQVLFTVRLLLLLLLQVATASCHGRGAWWCCSHCRHQEVLSAVSCTTCSSSTSASATDPPAEQPQPSKAAKWHRDQPPAWFQSFVEEHWQWWETFCEECRQEFAVLERQNNGCLKIFRRSSHHPSLCNFLIRSYQSSISIVLHLPPLILNPSLSSLMTSVLSSPPQQPHPMNLSSPVTLTFISIILQTLSPLSFCLFSLLSILVNMFTSLHTTKITFLI